MPDLWLVDLFCPIKKKFHTPPYCTPCCASVSLCLEWDFEGLKNYFLSDKTPIFLTFSAHKGLICKWKNIEYDNCKWSKTAIKFGRFSQPHSPLLTELKMTEWKTV